MILSAYQLDALAVLRERHEGEDFRLSMDSIGFLEVQVPDIPGRPSYGIESDAATIYVPGHNSEYVPEREAEPVLRSPLAQTVLDAMESRNRLHPLGTRRGR